MTVDQNGFKGNNPMQFGRWGKTVGMATSDWQQIRVSTLAKR